MNQKPAWHPRKILKVLSSLKLAVFIILGIATLTAIGTIIESQYDAYAAKKLIYDTPYMYAMMGLLCTSLIAVILDRWPWKKRHIAFITAHIGILILLFGAWLTTKYGLDGTLRVPIGQSNNLAQVPETDVVVYSSFDGDRYSKTEDREVDFFTNPPTKDKPYKVATIDPEASIQFIDYYRYAFPSKKIVEVKEGNYGSGLRFQIENANVNVVEWLVQTKPTVIATHNFGPAQVHLGPAPAEGLGKNEIYFSWEKEKLNYVVYQKDSKKPHKKGVIAEGGSFDPGFKMGMNVRVLRFMPKAQETWEVTKLERPTPVSTSAAKVLFKGKEHWILLNDMLKLFTENAVYLVSFGQRRIDIGFPLKLADFKVDRYQGTNRASAYISRVELPDASLQEISMNEPLKYKKLTIYQASFQEENGQPVASIFSVNYDPGRPFKYAGSLIMTLGILLLMYFKHLDFKLTKKQEK